MAKYTTFATLEGWHTVDDMTDVTIERTGAQVPSYLAPFEEAVLIPPFATRGVRLDRRAMVRSNNAANRAPKQTMRVRS